MGLLPPCGASPGMSKQDRNSRLFVHLSSSRGSMRTFCETRSSSGMVQIGRQTDTCASKICATMDHPAKMNFAPMVQNMKEFCCETPGCSACCREVWSCRVVLPWALVLERRFATKQHVALKDSNFLILGTIIAS